MEFILDSVRADWEAFLSFSPRIGYAVVVLVLIALAEVVSEGIVLRFMQRVERLRPNALAVRNIVRIIFVFLGILSALAVMGFKGIAASMLATGGVVAIVLGFAFREIGENLLAGVFLAFSRPFDVGDLIMTDGLTGTIRSIDIRSVHIRTADACDVYVPSAQIFRQPLYNYTRDGLRRQSFTVGVAYDNAPETVVALLRDTIGSVEDLSRDHAPSVLIREFSANYIDYEVFFFVDTFRVDRPLAAVATDARIACWRTLRDAGMTFSSDVTTSLEIRSLPPTGPGGPGSQAEPG